jgi:hypothetical protein
VQAEKKGHASDSLHEAEFAAGLAGDRHVLQTVRTWKYRPATCNGVPTEIEGKIEFSSR